MSSDESSDEGDNHQSYKGVYEYDEDYDEDSDEDTDDDDDSDDKNYSDIRVERYSAHSDGEEIMHDDNGRTTYVFRPRQIPGLPGVVRFSASTEKPIEEEEVEVVPNEEKDNQLPPKQNSLEGEKKQAWKNIYSSSHKRPKVNRVKAKGQSSYPAFPANKEDSEVTSRLLSAGNSKMTNMRNLIHQLRQQLGDLTVQNESLKSYVERQGDVIMQWNGGAKLPRFLRGCSEKIYQLKDDTRMMKREKRELCEEIRQRETQILKTEDNLKAAEEIIESRGLEEAGKLNARVHQLEEEVVRKNSGIRNLTNEVYWNDRMLRATINEREHEYKKAVSELKQLEQHYKKMTYQLRCKDKELNKTNIYSQKFSHRYKTQPFIGLNTTVIPRNSKMVTSIGAPSENLQEIENLVVQWDRVAKGVKLRQPKKKSATKKKSKEKLATDEKKDGKKERKSKKKSKSKESIKSSSTFCRQLTEDPHKIMEEIADEEEEHVLPLYNQLVLNQAISQLCIDEQTPLLPARECNVHDQKSQDKIANIGKEEPPQCASQQEIGWTPLDEELEVLHEKIETISQEIRKQLSREQVCNAIEVAPLTVETSQIEVVEHSVAVATPIDNNAIVIEMNDQEKEEVLKEDQKDMPVVDKAVNRDISTTATCHVEEEPAEWKQEEPVFLQKIRHEMEERKRKSVDHLRLSAIDASIREREDFKDLENQLDSINLFPKRKDSQQRMEVERQQQEELMGRRKKSWRFRQPDENLHKGLPSHELPPVRRASLASSKSVADGEPDERAGSSRKFGRRASDGKRASEAGFDALHLPHIATTPYQPSFCKAQPAKSKRKSDDKSGRRAAYAVSKEAFPRGTPNDEKCTDAAKDGERGFLPYEHPYFQ